jgi:hypothetical protein
LVVLLFCRNLNDRGAHSGYASVVTPEGGSFWGGAYMRLYYADRFQWPDIRILVGRDLHFWRGD